MGIVTRTPYVSGADITAEGQNANEDAIVNDHNGNIVNINIHAAAGIEGTKLADSPNGVPTIKINDSAVTTAKIVDDAVDANKLKDDAAIDSNRAVTTNHIRDLAVTVAKLAADAVTAVKVAADAIIAAKVKTAVFTQVIPNGAFTGNIYNTGLGSTIKPLAVYFEGPTPSGLPNEQGLTASLWFDTSTNTWKIAVNTDLLGSSVTIASVSVKLLYITAS